jgi:hypothetical protein
VPERSARRSQRRPRRDPILTPVHVRVRRGRDARDDVLRNDVLICVRNAMRLFQDTDFGRADMARGQSHGLGVGKGSIIDYGGGMIEYRQTGKLLPAFKVNIADVTGFSVRKATKQDKKNGASGLQQVFVLQGSGTEVATCPVNYGTAEKIEAWIRAHPSFRGNVPQNAPAATPQITAPVNLADELTKLAQLRDAGVLSPAEFDQAKAKLLS